MDTQLTPYTGGLDPITLVEASGKLSKTTKAQYTKALRGYLDTGADLGDPLALADYAHKLPQSGRSFLRAAVNLWANRMTIAVKGMATPETVDAVAASVYRFEAIKTAIDVQPARGTKAHTWLSNEQVKRLSNAIGNGIEGARDRVAIGLLVAAGLRREEAVTLTWEAIVTKPVGDRFRTVLAVKGKGAKDREVPISNALAADLDKWGKHVEYKGRILRSLGMRREIGASLSAVALFKLVQKYGAIIGKPDLAPHDLRRTYAQLGFEAGTPITQISRLLGHADVGTTQRYLNLDLNLETTASDFIPWG